jgi:isopentenyl-diphosphate delta-isomerase
MLMSERPVLNRKYDPPRKVILCDAAGRSTGTADLTEAHSGEGQLHLAFSVYLFQPDRRSTLVQRRSNEKRLWPNVWANTCCSHTREGEPVLEGARRRLREEMGIGCELRPGPEFIYRAVDPRGLGVEHEFDLTFTGIYSGEPIADPAEVCAWKWVDLNELQQEMRQRPDSYAPWFHIGLPKVLAALNASCSVSSHG